MIASQTDELTRLKNDNVSLYEKMKYQESYQSPVNLLISKWK